MISFCSQTLSKGITVKALLKPVVGEAPMFDNIEIMRMAHGLAVHASSRQSAIARNIAHADTPGYRAQDVNSFGESYRAADYATALRATRARHIQATQGPLEGELQTFDIGAEANPNGNTVSIETEMVKATEVRQQHEMALTIYKSALDVLRTSLGRR